jgi:hypothetical protein
MEYKLVRVVCATWKANRDNMYIFVTSKWRRNRREDDRRDGSITFDVIPYILRLFYAILRLPCTRSRSSRTAEAKSLVLLDRRRPRQKRHA